MPWTIERLRLAIVALAALLLLAIAGSFLYGRWRLRHVGQDLPARLGIQIQQSTQGFVLSKTEQGRPLFTLHAARAVQFKSGEHVSLHDVEIDLYNRQTGVADTIAGDDFEYDPRNQIVRSQGEAHIVLHPPANNGRGGVVGDHAGQPVRITTHGLIFNRLTGVATCSGEVDFAVADASGQAVGAEFDSKQGHLLLESQVVLTTLMQGKPAVLHASRAVYDRDVGQVHLWQPRYQSSAQSGTAEMATVLLRRNGSAERLDAQGAVRLVSADGMEVRAPALQVALNERSQPEQAHFSGGVEFGGKETAQEFAGNARQAEVDFDDNGRANRMVLNEAVELHQQALAGDARLERRLTANHLVLHLVPAKTGNAQLRAADASGNAVFTSRSMVPGSVGGHTPQQETSVAAQTLHAKFAAGNQLQRIDGAGQTRLKTIAANGDVDTSTGDTLQIEFTPSAPGKHGTGTDEKNPTTAAQSIRTALQTGHVVLQQVAKGNAGHAAQVVTAAGERAKYLAATDTLTLTGEPMFRDGQLRMTADRMEFERAAGTMTSTGAVQATLISSGSGFGAAGTTASGALFDGKQPVHIIAERATVTHSDQMAVFSGRARLWQGSDTIEAPVIALSQKTQTLQAYGSPSCEQCVIGNFLEASVPGGRTKDGTQAKPSGPATFRVLSRRLIYSDAERKASFLHDVQAIGASGVMTADNAEIFLTPAASAGKEKDSAAAPNQRTPSAVRKMVATGQVRLLQPGRSATGTRLVYTAEDGHFVLTGDEKDPPRVVDAEHGTVTGQVLTFAAREQAIMVSGTSGHETVTETRVQKR